MKFSLLFAFMLLTWYFSVEAKMASPVITKLQRMVVKETQNNKLLQVEDKSSPMTRLLEVDSSAKTNSKDNSSSEEHEQVGEDHKEMKNKKKERHKSVSLLQTLNKKKWMDEFTFLGIEYDGIDEDSDADGLTGKKLLAAWKADLEVYTDKKNRLALLPGCDDDDTVYEFPTAYHNRCHKCGGVMFLEVVREYQEILAKESPDDQIFVKSVQSTADVFPEIPEDKPSFLVGTHRSPQILIQQLHWSETFPDSITFQTRDPRDVLVSGYFYHKATTETWAHTPQAGFDGLSYQEKLNSYDSEEDGMLFEMEGRAKITFREMYQWTQLTEVASCAVVKAVKYEDLWQNTEDAFKEVGSFHSLKHVDEFVEAADAIISSSKNHKITVHMAGGNPGKWMDHFTPSIKKRFKQLYGDLVVQLGYETDNDW